MAIQLPHLWGHTRASTKGACLCPLHKPTLGLTCLLPLEQPCGCSQHTRLGRLCLQARCWASKACQLRSSCWDLAGRLLEGHLWAPLITHPRAATTLLSSRARHWPLAHNHPFIAPSTHRPSSRWSLPLSLVPRHRRRPRQARPFPLDHPSPLARAGSLHHPLQPLRGQLPRGAPCGHLCKCCHCLQTWYEAPRRQRPPSILHPFKGPNRV